MSRKNDERVEKARWKKLKEILDKIPMKGEVTVGFMAWAVSEGEGISDPLDDNLLAFCSAWAAWKAGRESVIDSEHMGRVAAWIDGGHKGEEPVRMESL